MFVRGVPNGMGVFEQLGIRLDRPRNESNADVVSVPGASVVRVIATNEELMIARHTAGVVSRLAPDPDLRESRSWVRNR